MQCPRCKSRTLVLQKCKRVCKVPECFYQDQHPISFDNDVRHYEGQKGGQNRFSSLYNASLDFGGVSVNHQGKHDKQIKNGLKHIRDICMLLKLNPKIQATAQARFITISQIKIKENLLKEQKKKNQKDKQDGENKKTQKKNKSVKELATYSVYSACFENDNFYEDYNLATWLGVSRKQWETLLKSIQEKIKNKIDFIPVEKPWHYIKKICRKRKIDPQQQRAMIKMCQIISQKAIQCGCPRKTVAACVFWKICQHSKKYKNIKLTDICKKTDEYNELPSKEAQKYFETTQETIRKFFQDKMQKTFYQQYLPYWQGRLDI